MTNKKTPDITTPFGERLFDAMGDMSVYALAKGIGVSQTQIRNYLYNGRLPRIDNARELATFLKVSYIWLATGEGKKHIIGPNSPEALSPDNLKSIYTDLFTVYEAIEQETNKEAAQKIVSACIISAKIGK